MRTKNIFFNKKNRNNAKESKIIVDVISGKYGYYGKYYGSNFSQKKLEKEGFELTNLSLIEIEKIKKLEKKRAIRIEKERFVKKINDRSKQVEICLNSKPLVIEENPYFGNGSTVVRFCVNLGETDMIEAYHGCGNGTAYVSDNKLVAFHYGYEAPSNIPTNCENIRVELSGTQVCFL